MGIHEHDPVPWTEVERNFDHVLELEPEAREKWLTDVEVTRPEVVREIRARLTKLQALDAAGVWQAFHGPGRHAADDLEWTQIRSDEVG